MWRQRLLAARHIHWTQPLRVQRARITSSAHTSVQTHPRVLGLTVLAGVLGLVSYSLVKQPIALDAAQGGKNAGKKDKTNLIAYDEVQKHNTEDDIWVVIHGKVYDLTSFAAVHPGGLGPILRNAGTEATAIYDTYHGRAFLTTMLTPEQCVGEIDKSTIPASLTVPTEDDKKIAKARKERPPLGAMISLDDFETVAHSVLPKTAWAYYAGAADDEVSHRNNLHAYSRYFFRPRVMRDVSSVDPSTTIQGIPSSLPIFISPAALAGLGHPLGEVNLTRGAAKGEIIQAVSTNASLSVDEIAAARTEGQPLIYQLYVKPDRAVSEALVRKVEKLGFKAIMITVDTPVTGKREADMRAKGVFEEGGEQVLGTALAMGTICDPALSWKDIQWLKSVTSLPLIIKGVQCVEDVELSKQHGAAGVLLSNHGGRQLAYAPASIDVLYEVRQTRPDLLNDPGFEIYIDGGCRRGTDVLKALCLGAKAVGFGRPFLYANGSYGEEGVAKAISVLHDEISRGMALLGVTRLDQLKPEMVHRLESGGFPSERR